MTSGNKVDFRLISPMTGLRRFSKLVCLSTLFLVFAGGMVTSTGSGLAVPDWPLSYGTLFPPMVGGIFYEHGHRMAAAAVGLLTLCLTLWLGCAEKRRWVRLLGVGVLGAVVLQGILGGMTVLFLLPAPVSIAHGILAQSFFILTIVIAYSQSLERQKRQTESHSAHKGFLWISLTFIVLVYIQLIMGALMRHTASGLAIPDFPTMAGYGIPPFNTEMLGRINAWRFEHDLDPVQMPQVIIHFLHRLGAAAIAVFAGVVTYSGLKSLGGEARVMRTIWYLDALVGIQLVLGALTVITHKSAHITSLHVVTGAAVLGVSILLFLRAAPLSMNHLRKILGE